ncbi:hypothetical protein [Streptomyces sp. NPDC017086]|uniref:hypothetical protein n=1 Tax=Streptomyces sp. NPDC017086 TaxID=3364976 RepID=UPI00379209E6
MPHQMLYLGRPADALGLLGVTEKKVTLPATRALVDSQAGRVHAALGDEQSAERDLGAADELVAGDLGEVPERVAYFDVAGHAGARAVSARDLAGLHGDHRSASVHFADALRLRRPGFDRVKGMDRVGLTAALFTEGEPEQGAPAAHQALDDATRVDSALVASRLNTLLDAARLTGPQWWTMSVPARRISQRPGRALSRPESMESMGKHARPGPANQPSRSTSDVDRNDPLAAYE